MLPVGEWGTKGCFRSRERQLSSPEEMYLCVYRPATERASVSLSLSDHGLLPHRHTLGTEPTLLHDPMAHTQVLYTAGWSHIQLPLTCVDINTWLSNWLNSFWTQRCSTCCQTPSWFFRKGSGNETRHHPRGLIRCHYYSTTYSVTTGSVTRLLYEACNSVHSQTTTDHVR